MPPFLCKSWDCAFALFAHFECESWEYLKEMYKAILTIAFLVMTYEISIVFIAIVKASTYFLIKCLFSNYY